MQGLELGDGMKDAAWLAVFLLLFLAIFLIGRPSKRWRTPRSRPSWPPPRTRPSWQAPPTRFRDHERDLLAAKQLRLVRDASFKKKRILNSGEYRVFRIIESELNSIRRGYRAFPQTNLGEVLACPDEDAFFSVNSKRVDILVVDYSGWPVLAVEYQGKGHYQGTAIARDTVKSIALRNAGVGYLEVFEADGDNEIRNRLRQHLSGTGSSGRASFSTQPRPA